MERTSNIISRQSVFSVLAGFLNLCLSCLANVLFNISLNLFSLLKHNNNGLYLIINNSLWIHQYYLQLSQHKTKMGYW